MARHGKRRRGGQDAEHDENERWLVSYADMVTLLMALFIVLFAIANVNTSKFEELKQSLTSAFDGPVKEGGGSVLDGGASDGAVQGTILDERAGSGKTAAQQEAEDLRKLKERIDAYARERGLADKLSARIERRGLVITILTDELLFDSGSAVLRPEGRPLVRAVGGILRAERKHQVVVEGHTDTVPISGRYPSNWELSTARAASIVRVLIDADVGPRRLLATGRAYYDPVASNATERGRMRNRRVQIVLPRQSASPISAEAEPPFAVPAPALGPAVPQTAPEEPE